MGKQTIIYNIKSIPPGMELDEVLEIYYSTKVLMYDGQKPHIIDKDNLDLDIVIVDTSKYEINDSTE